MPDSKIIPLFPADSEPDRQMLVPQQAERVWDSLPALKGRVAASRAFTTSDEREVSDMILQARRQTDEMRAQARAEADAMIEAAWGETERIREEARAAGYSTGLSKARAEIAEELGAKFDARCEALNQSIAALIDAIIEERGKMWSSIENEVAALALEIARKIVKIEVTSNPQVVKTIAQDGLRRVTDRGAVRIVVNPDDLQNIRASRQDLLQAIDGIENLIIDADRRVGRGGCMIETSAGSIDAKLDTQFDQVDKAMKI